MGGLDLGRFWRQRLASSSRYWLRRFCFYSVSHWLSPFPSTLLANWIWSRLLYLRITIGCFARQKPSEGPVVVTMEFEIASTDRWKFLRLMREMRLTYLRNGAFPMAIR